MLGCAAVAETAAKSDQRAKSCRTFGTPYGDRLDYDAYGSSRLFMKAHLLG